MRKFHVPENLIKDFVTRQLNGETEEVEKQWETYLKNTYEEEYPPLDPLQNVYDDLKNKLGESDLNLLTQLIKDFIESDYEGNWSYLKIKIKDFFLENNRRKNILHQLSYKSEDWYAHIRGMGVSKIRTY